MICALRGLCTIATGQIIGVVILRLASTRMPHPVALLTLGCARVTFLDP